MIGFGKGVTSAENGMIAAAHPLVAEAGLLVLKAGGNAVDAAAAAGLTAAVVMPEMCGLGGDLFALIHVPGRAPAAVLGAGAAPLSVGLGEMRERGVMTAHGAKMPLVGPMAIGTPGMPAAYGAMIERFGTWRFADVVIQAVGHADGFTLTRGGAAAIADAKDLLECDVDAAAVFLPGGRPPKAGERLRQPGLAATLRRLAEHGTEDFYRGRVAQQLTASIAAKGGALAAEDLARHSTRFDSPISTTYRGFTVHQIGLPSQGMILLEALNIIEHVDPVVLRARGANAIHQMAEALKLAFADRLGFAIDPAFGSTPLDRLTSKEWAAERYKAIGAASAAEAVPPGQLVRGDTTYLCAADRSGMMVSLIQSVSSAFGSGVVAGETGVLMNNRVGRGFTLQDGHPNVYAPGKTTISTLNCFSLAGPDGKAMLVGGTPGGDGQPQWGLQMLVDMIDGGMSAAEACAAPRWAIWPGTDPANLPNPYELLIEDRVDAATLTALAGYGHRLRRLGPWQGGGAAQIIARAPDGRLAGGSDPRVEGFAAGF